MLIQRTSCSVIETEYGYVKEGIVYRKSFRNFPDKPIGETKTDEPSSFAYFEERFKMAESKISDLESAVELAENKGSYLMKLIHLKEYLINVDAIGDFEALFLRLEKLEQLLSELISKTRANNLLIKKGLIEEAEKLRGSSNWKEDTDKFKALKAQWITTGNVDKALQEEVNNAFSEIVEDFFTRRQSYYQKKHQIVQGKLTQLKNLLYKAKSAARKPNSEARNELKLLQAEWKKVGKVTGNLARSLYQEFRDVCNAVFKSGYEGNSSSARIQDPEKILKEKQEMVQVVQKIADNPDPTAEDLEKIKDMQRLWKQIGQVPRDQSKTITALFYSGCSLINEKYFVNQIAEGKNDDFHQMSEKERLQVKIQIVRELLTRDQNELKIFQENLGMVNTNTNGGNKLISSKLSQQERKVRVKKRLLDELFLELKNK